jgi:hypothetical protein
MLGLRTATRAPFALSVFRNTAARRWSSGIGAKGLEGPADNAFNRERAAVKQHAADTSGEWNALEGVVGHWLGRKRGRILGRVVRCGRKRAEETAA